MLMSFPAKRSHHWVYEHKASIPFIARDPFATYRFPGILDYLFNVIDRH